LPITLKATTINGEDCVELYAHGDTLSYETGEMAKRAVLLARVTARELTMYPLGADAHRTGFLEPKYDELRTITVVAEEHNPWWLPESVQDFDEMLTTLPTGFARHAIYGLGFKWEYRLIPEAILEMVGVTELVIEPETAPASSSLHLGLASIASPGSGGPSTRSRTEQRLAR